MKFGGAEISRMVLGVNPFYGYAHYNQTSARARTDPPVLAKNDPDRL
jgi:hypothetical protein